MAWVQHDERSESWVEGDTDTPGLLLHSAHSGERSLLRLRPHTCGERLRPTEAAITGLHERIDAVGDQSEGHNA